VDAIFYLSMIFKSKFLTHASLLLAESVRAKSHAAADKAGGRDQRQRSILAITDDDKDKDKMLTFNSELHN